MVKRQADEPAPGISFFLSFLNTSDWRKGPVSAVAAWKAKQNSVGNIAIENDSEQTLPSNQDKENHGVAPPAKKQKIEPQTNPSEPRPLKKDNTSKARLPPLPVPQRSQSSVQATSTRDSLIDVDQEKARDKNETLWRYKHTQVSHDGITLEDDPTSDGEKGEILDSE